MTTVSARRGMASDLGEQRGAEVAERCLDHDEGDVHAGVVPRLHDPDLVLGIADHEEGLGVRRAERPGVHDGPDHGVVDTRDRDQHDVALGLDRADPRVRLHPLDERDVGHDRAGLEQQRGLEQEGDSAGGTGREQAPLDAPPGR